MTRTRRSRKMMMSKKLTPRTCSQLEHLSSRTKAVAAMKKSPVKAKRLKKNLNKRRKTSTRKPSKS